MKKYKIRFHKILLLLGVFYLMFLVGAYFLQEKIIFIPSEKIYLEIDKEKLHAEEFNLEVNNQTTLHGYFFAEKRPLGTIVFFHNNGGNLTNNFGRVAIAKKLGYNIVLFDYRGYGKSTGKIKNEEDLYQDAETVINYLIQQKKISLKSMIFWGEGLGGAVALEMAKRFPAKKLILESTFASLNNITPNVIKYTIPNFLKKYKFDNLQKIAEIKIPILIIHSLDDNTINFTNGEKLFEKNSAKKNEFLKLNGSHEDSFYDNFEQKEEFIKNFLEN